MSEIKHIPVSIDKSHLVTIGEKMYSDKIDLLRELVSNAHDADATEVQITLSERQLIVHDNGSGMDEVGLHTYFTIGSHNKKDHPVSPKFKRARIGEFGIGKFAVLAACKVFQVETQQGSFHARLVFDKKRWQEQADWQIAIEILPHNPDFGTGTRITLVDLEQAFPTHRVRRYLRERVPLHIPQFVVLVNGERIEEEIFYGRTQKFDVATSFGHVIGTLVLTNSSWTTEDAGIGIYVKNTLITKETFGLEMTKRLGATRLRGKIYADFLPITSNRDNVIRDTPEFIAVREVIEKEIRKILKVAKALANQRADQRSSQALKDAMTKLGKALKKQEYLKFDSEIPFGEAIATASEPGSEDATVGTGFDVSNAQFVNSGENLSPDVRAKLDQIKTKRGRGRPSVALGERSIIRKLRFQNVEVAVRLEHLEADNEESMVSGGIVYINTDHALYQLYQADDSLLLYHMTRLITKELAQQASPGSAATAFRIQSDLLTEAFKYSKKV